MSDCMVCAVYQIFFIAPKQWYGIPSYEAERFEDVMRKVTKSKSPDLVYQVSSLI